MLKKLLLIPARPGAHQAAVRRALDLSAASAVEIEIFDPVYEPLLEGYYGDKEIYEPLRRRVVAERAEAARNIAEELRRHGRKASAEALWEHPFERAIARRVVERDIDLVVTQPLDPRRGELSNLDWRLVSTCPVPVLVVKSDGSGGYRKIVAAVDPLHAHAKPAELDNVILTQARALQTLLNAELQVVHCFVPLAQLTGGLDIELPLEQTERALEDLRRSSLERLVHAAGVPTSVLTLAAGEPELVLQQMAERGQADLVIMGAISRGRIKELLIGSTADRFLRRSPVDVLVVKPRSVSFETP